MEDFLKCQICIQNYNSRENRPLGLSCGHTFCSKCLIEMSKKDANGLIDKCPVCHQIEPIPYKKIKTNINLMQIVENQNQQQNFYCDNHEKKITKYNFTKKVFICEDCDQSDAILIDQSYVFQSLQDIEDEYSQKILKFQYQLKMVQDLKNKNNMSTKEYSDILNNANVKLEDFKYFQEQKNKNQIQQQIQINNNQLFAQDPNLYQNIVQQSNILTQNMIGQLITFTKIKNLQLKLIYQATRDGFKGAKFHELCDNKGRTIIVIKSDYQEIFGGYAAIPWKQNQGQQKGARNSFLFSLTKNTKHNCTDYKNELFGTFINNQKGDSASFGKMIDLHIVNDSNAQFCSSNIGQCYQLPPNVQKDSEDARSYLGGDVQFKTVEIETYQVIQ